MSSRIDSFTGALNKCYEDMLHFKDLSSELIQNFKYDIMFEQDRVLKNIGEI